MYRRDNVNCPLSSPGSRFCRYLIIYLCCCIEKKSYWLIWLIYLVAGFNGVKDQNKRIRMNYNEFNESNPYARKALGWIVEGYMRA